MKALPCILPCQGRPLRSNEPLAHGRWWETPHYRARNRIGDFYARKQHKREEDMTRDEGDDNL